MKVQKTRNILCSYVLPPTGILLRGNLPLNVTLAYREVQEGFQSEGSRIDEQICFDHQFNGNHANTGHVLNGQVPIHYI